MSNPMKRIRRIALPVLRFFLVYVLLAPILICCSYMPVSSRKFYKRAVVESPFDAIIVPGLPYNGRKWSLGLKARIYWAKYLVEEGHAKNVIFSGTAAYTPYVESEIMKLYATQVGISPEIIKTESKAEFSIENMYYSYVMARDLGYNKIAVATDPFQTRKLLRLNKKFNLPVTFFPVVFGILENMEQPDYQIEAKDALVDNFTSISKTYGFLGIRKGTKGLKLLEEIESTLDSEVKEVR